MSARSPKVGLRNMSVAFLECKTFHDILLEEARLEHVKLMKSNPTVSGIYGMGLKECCPTCHTGDNQRNLIYVRPFQDGAYGHVGNTDWDMCIEATICCKLYDYVRSLPREWWIKKATELGVYREDPRGYIYPNSPHRNTTRSQGGIHLQKRSLKASTARCKSCACKVFGIICENCGTAQ